MVERPAGNGAASIPRRMVPHEQRRIEVIERKEDSIHGSPRHPVPFHKGPERLPGLCQVVFMNTGCDVAITSTTPSCSSSFSRFDRRLGDMRGIRGGDR